MPLSLLRTESEYEYTFSNKCSLLNFYDNQCDSEIISHFYNGTHHYRVINGRVETKVITKRTNFLEFKNGVFYPIIYTESAEGVYGIDSSYDAFECKHKLTKVVVRKIIKYIETDTYKLRHSLELHQQDLGENYYEKVELEFDGKCDCVSILVDYLSTIITVIEFQYVENLMTTNAHKLQPITKFNQNAPYYWAYKWNGIRLKCTTTNSTNPEHANDVLTVDDVGGFSTLKINIDCIKFLVFLIEKIDCGNGRVEYVLIEASYASFCNEIYTTSPKCNHQFLEYMKLQNITLNNQTLHVQHFYSDEPMPSSSDVLVQHKHLPTIPLKHVDGFVVLQAEHYIKIKYPTIDARFVGTNKFLVGQKTYFYLDQFQYKKNAIYELQFDETGLHVIRDRKDRIVQSSQEELQSFVHTCKELNFALNKYE